MGQYINPVNRCVRPDFCYICISLRNSEFIMEFSRETATNGSIELFSIKFSTNLFFFLENSTLLPISDGNAAFKHTIGRGWKYTHKYLKLLSSAISHYIGFTVTGKPLNLISALCLVEQ